MRVIHLLCEYIENPLGLDMPIPRLSWRLESGEQGTKQSAYQIIASVPLAIGKSAGDEQTLWESGKVGSNQSVNIAYAGPTLKSGQRVSWKVRVWDQHDQVSEWSKPAWWEMGLLDQNEWQAKWIGSFLVGGPRASIPVPYLRKSFALDLPVASARLYVTALGLYEAFLNGSRIGDAELAPGWTDFHRRIYYQTYDVTGLLREGENVLGALLGDGWYCGHLQVRDRQLYGDRPKLLARLVITHPDGTQTVVVSDESWKHAFGPLLQSDLIQGEHYDGRLEFPGWDRPHFDTSCWFDVQTFLHPESLHINAQRCPLVKTHEQLKPVVEPFVTKDEWGGSTFLFDLGQNMTGRVRLHVRGAPGTTVRLRFGEALNLDGSLYIANLRTARATDYYTCKGGGEEIWEPKFTFHGFRYVELKGAIEKPTRHSIVGVVLHSDLPVTGSFECSDPLLNQLQHNILWGWKGNTIDVPTDCPQRDERLGWTGDGQIFCRTSMFNSFSVSFWSKWLRDLEDSQGAAGNIPMFAPDLGEQRSKDGGPAYADAAVIVPWTAYICYADTRLLEESYGMLTRFVDWAARTSPGLIRADAAHTPFAGFGDWLALDGSGRRDGGTPKDLIGTAFLAYSAQLASRAADCLGNEDDVHKYAKLYAETRTAFQKRFVTPEGYVTGRTQTSYILALAFDLLPKELVPAAMDWLVRDIEERKDHLSTGFVGTPYLPHVLTRYGRLDLAYRLLLQQTWPSWLYAVTQGATTIWERWDGCTHDKGFQDPSMNSFNHYAYGAIGDWLYSTVAGIEADPQKPGYQHILFHPQPGGGLTHARGSLESLYGQIVSDWHIHDGNFEWDIHIPPNTTATVLLPGETQAREVEAGSYHLSVAI